MSKSASLAIPFANSYASLPAQFYAESTPVPVVQPSLIVFNHRLAEELGMDSEQVSDSELGQVFAGNVLPKGAKPLAMAYSGHQFGHLNPRLGDGRALLLGEVQDLQGQRRDIHLKGSGPTPFTRGGDGRAPMGPVLREYIMCEAMHALGVPTTRALAAVQSGEWVYRQGREPGAVFTRVAASHVRVGTFQYFALRRDHEALSRLADYIIERNFGNESQQWPKNISPADRRQRYLAMFDAICQRQAKLIAQWMQLGFIHGVMNTDNMIVSGETIDYGPCAFIDAFDPAKVFSSIDVGGRYAWQNQPAIGQWNLARLAEALLPLIDTEEQSGIRSLTEILDHYPQAYDSAWLDLMRAKLGLSTSQPGDHQLIEGLLTALQQGKADYTLFFRQLCNVVTDEQGGEQNALETLSAAPSALRAWLSQWRQRLTDEDIGAAERKPRTAERKRRMQAVNPAFIPRNHRIAEVIKAAEYEQDFKPFYTLLKVLSCPYQEQPEYQHFSNPPEPQEQVVRTFCGT